MGRATEGADRVWGRPASSSGRGWRGTLPPGAVACPLDKDCQPAMDSLERFAREKLRRIDKAALRRHLVETDRQGGIHVRRGGRTLLSFCCNDYLNLSQEPELKAAAVRAVETLGVGAGASRLVTGNHSLYQELEGRLAKLKQTEAACVFGSGYLTNLGVIPTLVGAGDLVVLDELSHACIHAGTSVSAARCARFRHNDLEHAEQLLKEHRSHARRALIVTDGVFSMDGDLAPIEDLADLAERFDAWLMTDDAHGIGVLGGGRGSSFLGGTKARVPLQMGTLSKAVGSYGGYLCASEDVIELVRNRARPLIYSTGLPPAAVAASIAALDWIENHPEQAALPLAKAQRFTQAVGLPKAQSSIVPLVLGAPERALEASLRLEREGFLVTAIRPPTVPEGTARLRITFTAAHEDADVDRLAELVRDRILGA